MYMTPSTTSGVASNRVLELARLQLVDPRSSRFLTFSGVICVSSLCRWLYTPPEYVSQFCGSCFACRIRSKVTCARSVCSEATTSTSDQRATNHACRHCAPPFLETR